MTQDAIKTTGFHRTGWEMPVSGHGDVNNNLIRHVQDGSHAR